MSPRTDTVNREEFAELRSAVSNLTHSIDSLIKTSHERDRHVDAALQELSGRGRWTVGNVISLIAVIVALQGLVLSGVIGYFDIKADVAASTTIAEANAADLASRDGIRYNRPDHNQFRETEFLPLQAEVDAIKDDRMTAKQGEALTNRLTKIETILPSQIPPDWFKETVVDLSRRTEKLADKLQSVELELARATRPTQ